MKLREEERETVVSFGMLVVSLILFFSVFAIRNRGDVFGSPRLVPFIITGIMILLSLISLIKNAIKAFPTPKALWSSLKEVAADSSWRKIFITIAIVALYILVGIKFIGYYFSSFIVIFLCTLLLVKGLKWWKALIISIALSVLLYLLFAVLLRLPIK